jgi:hypothetical protein
MYSHQVAFLRELSRAHDQNSALSLPLSAAAEAGPSDCEGMARDLRIRGSPSYTKVTLRFSNRQLKFYDFNGFTIVAQR